MATELIDMTLSDSDNHNSIDPPGATAALSPQQVAAAVLDEVCGLESLETLLEGS